MFVRKTSITFAPLMNKYKTLIFSILIITLLASCNEYQKVVNGEDYNLKFETANALYEKEQYGKALPLYEELRKIFLGQEQMKTILLNLANCEFQTEQYYLASYHFKQFYEAYPFSKSAEDALFMHCTCLYTASPKHSLDQQSSLKAISAFEKFATSFPESNRVDECNRLIDELMTKMEYKAFISAKLYYKIEDYKAAVWALSNYSRDFPGSVYDEESQFLIVESAFKFASLSVKKKQEERYVETIDYFRTFKTNYPNSKYLKKAKEYFDTAQSELNNLVNKES